MKHFSRKHIKYRAFVSIFSSLFISSFFWGEIILESTETIKFSTPEVFASIMIFIIIYLISIGFSILSWKFTTYSIDSDSIILKKGILFKNRKILNYRNIHAIDNKQSIIQKLFKIKTLSIDSGATSTGGLPEIQIIEDEVESLRIEKLVKEKLGLKHNNDPQELNDGELIYKYSPLNKFTLACVVSLGVLLGLFMLYFIGSVIISVIGVSIEDGNLLLIILFALVILNIIIFLITYLYNLLTYYNYKVYKKDDYLIIKYGLLTKTNDILKINRIKAITIEESLIKRILGLATIKLEIVGFGDHNDEESTLSLSFNFYIPICKKKEINYYISKIMPDCTIINNRNKAKKESFKYFYILKVLVFLIVSFCFLPIPIYFNSYNAYIIYASLIAFGVIILIIDSIFLYNNSAISFDDKKLIVYTDSFFKITKIIPNKSLIGIEKIDTYFRRKDNTASFIIHFYNTSNKNTIRAHLLDSYLYDDILKLVRY